MKKDEKKKPIPVAFATVPMKHERVCYCCEYRVWAVGCGQGVICRHPEKTYPGHIHHIANLWDVCPLFTEREEWKTPQDGPAENRDEEKTEGER